MLIAHAYTYSIDLSLSQIGCIKTLKNLTTFEQIICKNCNNMCNCNKILVKVEARAKFIQVRVCN